jgi:hypothetical protein
MADCNEHVECLKEEIADYRYFEDIGLIAISIGVASLSLIRAPEQIVATLGLMVCGALIFSYGGKKKKECENKLCKLLKQQKNLAGQGRAR